jgi:hypothetical protein
MVRSCALPILSLGDWFVRCHLGDADILVLLLAGFDVQPSGAPIHWWTWQSGCPLVNLNSSNLVLLTPCG